MNLQLSLEIIHKLRQQGVDEYCLCPGGRNAPFVKALQVYPGVKIYSFFDERAAAFFALGRSKRDNKACAVVTTSGSAVANLLPAVVEAFYSHVPMVLLTADRPKNYRHSGAPQSIEQLGIFSSYVGDTYDFDVSDSVEFTIKESPVHINVCFDEPLLEDIEKAKAFLSDIGSINKIEPKATSVQLAHPQEMAKSFLDKARSPLVLLGAGVDLDIFIPQLLKLSLPIYAEASSGLRENEQLSQLLIQGGAKHIMTPQFLSQFDSVIRLGQVPTLRLWRELESKYSTWPVLSFTRQPFSGLARCKTGYLPLHMFSDFIWPDFPISSKTSELVEQSKEAQKKFEQKLSNHPTSEVSMVRKLSEWIPAQSRVFLGNSLSIREWDQAAIRKQKNIEIGCNRGVNGIDGLVSTALGWANKDKPTFCVLGDLSAMYDMNALHVVNQLNSVFHLVVINNGGGKIFKPMFRDPLFENSHNYNFKPLAEMFGLKYHRVSGEFPNTDFKQSSLVEVSITDSNS